MWQDTCNSCYHLHCTISFIPPFSSNYPYQSRREAGPYPSCHRWEAGFPPGQVASLSQSSFSLTHSSSSTFTYVQQMCVKPLHLISIWFTRSFAVRHNALGRYRTYGIKESSLLNNSSTLVLVFLNICKWQHPETRISKTHSHSYF